MSGTLYRRDRPTTLEDLMAQAGAQGGNPGAVPPPQAPQAQGSDQTDSRLLALLTQPENQGPAPEVDKLSTWDKIRMTIGDSLGSALQAYGAVLGGGSPPPLSNNYGKFVARQDQQKADLADWQKKLAESQREAKLRGANYILGKQEKADKLAQDKAATADERAYREKVAADAAMEHRLTREAAAASDAANIKARIDIEKMGNEARARSDNLQVELHKLRAAGEGDKDQHAEYAKARQFVVTKKAEYAQGLAEGKITPEQIVQEWRDTLDASDLSGQYKEAADAFFRDKVGAILMQYAPVQGPQVNPNPPPSQGQLLNQRQAVGQGPRY